MGEACSPAPTAPSIDRKVRWLGRASTYPETTGAVEVIETHMSWVFLTERHAYKLKKPIRYDVLDFSTVELRLRSCQRELSLNRRLAPDVYLAVVPLTLEPDGALRVAGVGPPVDWLVKMRRLPEARTLEHLIRRGAVTREDVDPAARALARFYQLAVPAGVDGGGYYRHLRDALVSDRQELLDPAYGLIAGEVCRVADEQLAYLETARPTVEGRIREGRVVEGHGDLRPEHIFLTHPPAIIDCLEFSRDLRIQDPADELSFLALECARLGSPKVGTWFFETYRGVTGDDPPAGLLRFYRRLRALRRAKIAVWHLREPDRGRAREWRDRARWYLTEAVLDDGTGE